MLYRDLHVVLVIPCLNEEKSISKVIKDFKLAMPELDIYVFDNCSVDGTVSEALAAGAKIVAVEPPGKGNVVRRIFADVEADILVIVDGDATYEAKAVTRLVDALYDNGLDMVIGCRISDTELTKTAYRPGHKLGNQLLTASVRNIFGGQLVDVLSGYRAFTRRYVKSFPALSRGFEVETEFTIHALELRMPIGEIQIQYGSRPEGSESKLSTFRDGFRILKTIAKLYIIERPLAFYSACAVLIAVISVGLSIPLIIEYAATGLVPRFPTAILSAAMMICALLSFACGLILDNVVRGRHELKRLTYLSIPHPKSRIKKAT